MTNATEEPAVDRTACGKSRLGRLLSRRSWELLLMLAAILAIALLIRMLA